ncbi:MULTISPECIES: allantoinase AllB [Microbacterium]|uniref:allantoinase AllB n=1 Tax=Microbacterium TaxID=33882 RepID=UPI000D64B6BA|nr:MULTISPECIES: allantoinase AllB [Microbacterium]
MTDERMPEHDLVVRGRRVLVRGAFKPCEVGITRGAIVAVEPLGAGLRGSEVVSLRDDETLLPGLVDTHVHVNEPGRTEWEGFASATKAAAAGGVTTIIDMPLNSIPPTISLDALERKRRAARDQVFVDVGFWGGAVPGNIGALRAIHDDGVFGFKCFLVPSGVDEFPALGAADLEHAMAELARFDGVLLVHAEDAATIAGAPAGGGRGYERFLASRPRLAEDRAIAQVVECARRTGARAHIVHLSSSDALPLIAEAKRSGVRVTVETCPHYLTLRSEDIADGATACKCCPPVREGANRDLLWQGLLEGIIDAVVSDHSPSTADLKDLENGDFAAAWGGIASLQLGMPLVWNHARGRGIPLEKVVEWMSARPAALAALARKGRIEPGADADLSVFAPDERFVVHADRLLHKNPVCPYDGWSLTGVVRDTFVRGERVDFAEPRGRLLRRGAA